jgi:hypothetical protein
MPAEQVRCENCGAGDVRQVAPDSYICQHCRTHFRWVDPTKRTVIRTVIHEPRVCECGKLAKVFCCCCKRGVCSESRHRHSVAKEWDSFFHGSWRRDDLDLVILEPWWDEMFGLCEPEKVQELLIRTAEQYGIGDGGFHCAQCVSGLWTAFNSALGPVLAEARERAVEKGRLCRECRSDRVIGQCIICGVGVCKSHGIVCDRCHQVACKQHIADGRRCEMCDKYLRSKSWWWRMLLGD